MTSDRSKRARYVAIAVIAAGVALAVGFLVFGDDEPGAASPEALIEAAIAAEAAGDVGALMALADPKAAFERGLDCTRRGARDFDSRTERLRDRFVEIAEKTKGLTIEVMTSREDRDAGGKEDVRAGKDVAGECTAKVDIRYLTYELELEVRDETGKRRAQEVEIEILDIGGRFFLGEAPEVKPPTNLGRVLDQLDELRDEMCACMDQACAIKVQGEFTRRASSWGKDAEGDDQPDDDDMKRMTDIITKFTECQMKVTSDTW